MRSFKTCSTFDLSDYSGPWSCSLWKDSLTVKYYEGRLTLNHFDWIAVHMKTFQIIKRIYSVSFIHVFSMSNCHQHSKTTVWLAKSNCKSYRRLIFQLRCFSTKTLVLHMLALTNGTATANVESYTFTAIVLWFCWSQIVCKMSAVSHRTGCIISAAQSSCSKIMDKLHIPWL